MLSHQAIGIYIVTAIALLCANKRLWSCVAWLGIVALVINADLLFQFPSQEFLVGMGAALFLYLIFKKKWKEVRATLPILLFATSYLFPNSILSAALMFAALAIWFINMQRKKAEKLPKDDPERWLNNVRDLETLMLFENGRHLLALTYFIASPVLGVVFTFAGAAVCRLVLVN